MLWRYSLQRDYKENINLVASHHLTQATFLLLGKVEVVVMCLSSNWEDRQLVPAFPFFWHPPSGDACRCWCDPSVGMYPTHIAMETIASGDSQGNFRSWEWVFVNIAPHSFEAFFLVRVLEGNLHHIRYMRSLSFGLPLELVGITKMAPPFPGHNSYGTPGCLQTWVRVGYLGLRC